MNGARSTIHQRLQQARMGAGFTRASAAAVHFGWNVPTYLAHENGTRGMRQSKIVLYAKAFQVDPAWLSFGYEEIKQIPEKQTSGGHAFQDSATAAAYPSLVSAIVLAPDSDQSASYRDTGLRLPVRFQDHISESASDSQAFFLMPSDQGAVLITGRSLPPVKGENVLLVLSGGHYIYGTLDESDGASVVVTIGGKKTSFPRLSLTGFYTIVKKEKNLYILH